MPEDPVDYEGRTRLLFARYRAGDRAAERALFEEHGQVLLAYVRRRIPRALRAEVEPEDVVGDVFRRALSGVLDVPEWRDPTPGGLARLLQTVADGVLVDLARHHGALKRSAPTLSLEDAEQRVGARPSELTANSASQTSQASYRELLALGEATLSPREWQVFRRVYVDGLSGSDVASELGETPEAVRGVLFRARAKLVERLARDEDGGPPSVDVR